MTSGELNPEAAAGLVGGRGPGAPIDPEWKVPGPAQVPARPGSGPPGTVGGMAWSAVE